MDIFPIFAHKKIKSSRLKKIAGEKTREKKTRRGIKVMLSKRCPRKKKREIPSGHLVFCPVHPIPAIHHRRSLPAVPQNAHVPASAGSKKNEQPQQRTGEVIPISLEPNQTKPNKPLGKCKCICLMSSFGFGSPPSPIFFSGVEPVIKKPIRQTLQFHQAAHAKSSIVVQNNKYSYKCEWRKVGKETCTVRCDSCIPQVGCR